MPTYQEYQKQITELQSLAEKVRQDEVARAREEVQNIMRLHNLTVADFAPRAEKAKPAAKKGTALPKYQDPTTGTTWSGRGRTPGWLQGQDRNNFLIKQK